MTAPGRDRTKAIALAKKAGWDPAWIRDPQDVRAVLDGCAVDAEAGQHVVDFFAWFLKHSKGNWAGQPFALLPWEEDIVRRLFGWKRADGTRRFRRGGIWIPKKNGKSTLAAGIELYMLVGDDEPGAEVYIGANDKSQAGIIYREAAQMVRTSQHLAKRLKPVDTTKTIAYPGMAGFLQALSADVPTKEGINAHAVIMEELHAQKKRGLWDTLEYAGAARRQPLVPLAISTAGVYNEHSIGWEQYQYAKRVLNDEIKDWAFFAVIYEAGPKDDWTTPKTWKKANPSWGVTIDPAVFAEECRAAQSSPARQNSFRRYRLNQWVQQITRAIDLAVWDGHRGHDVAAEALRGRACDSGLDISSVSDLTSAVHAFQCDDDEDALDIVCRFWIPEAQLHNEKNPNRALYQQWVDEGYLEATPGNVIDYEIVIAQLLEDAGVFEIRDLAYDRLFQGQHVANRLSEEGVNVFPMGQGFLSMGPAYREFERLHLAGKLHHGGHPVLRWCMENLQVAQDAHQNKKIVKPQGHLKVDGAVALVEAIDRARRHGVGDEESSSAYDESGLFTVGDDDGTDPNVEVW